MTCYFLIKCNKIFHDYGENNHNERNRWIINVKQKWIMRFSESFENFLYVISLSCLAYYYIFVKDIINIKKLFFIFI
jgi:hypothetical protein